MESGVGADWIHRMRWELYRVPRLQVQLGGPHILGPRRLNYDHLRTVRERSGWERATLALHFAALRQYLKWARNPVADERQYWRLPAGEPSRRRWLTREQLLRLFNASRKDERLLIALESFNGLRRVEVLRLRVQDVLRDEGCLRVLGKGRDGGRWRTIPMHPTVAKLLAPRLAGRAPAERLFPLSKSGADALLQRAVRRSHLRKEGTRVSHHDLRRTFGRLSHEAGMDLVQLKNLFGHASLEMTVHYIGLDADEMRSGLVRLGHHLGLEPKSR